MRQSKIRKLLQLAGAAFMCVGLQSPAWASSYQGTVTNVYPIGTVVLVFVGNGFFDGQPTTCSTGSSMAYIVDPATPFGRVLVSVALAAKLSGKLVHTTGNNVCEGPYERMTAMDLKG